MRAEVRWLPPERGGRPSIPQTNRYSTVARFEHQTEQQWLEEAWSLVLNCTAPAQDGVQVVDVRFLAADAPGDWLLPGRRFELLEGARKVADGTVLAEFEEVRPSSHAE